VSHQRVHDPAPRFPPSGPGGTRPPTSTVLSGRYDFLPPFPPHFVAFAWRYHSGRLIFASVSPRRHSRPTRSVWDAATPQPRYPVETTGSPKFSGNPHCPFAMFCDPGRPVRPRPVQDVRTAPASDTTKAPTSTPFRGSIAWPSSSLSTLRRMGHPTQRKTRFEVLVRLSWTGLLTRKVPSKGFRVLSYISSPFPKLGLARIQWSPISEAATFW
jgi:hypothetical protein